MTSAICSVNEQSISTTGTSGINVSSGSTVTVTLVNNAGVISWDLVCTSCDDQTNPVPINNSISINSITFTATFTAPTPVNGAAMQFTSTVNAGRYDQQVFTFGVFVLTVGGYRVFFGGESDESNATVGCAADENALVRSAGALVDVSIVDGSLLTLYGPISHVTACIGSELLATTTLDNTATVISTIPMPGSDGYVPGSVVSIKGPVAVPSSGTVTVDCKLTQFRDGYAQGAEWKFSGGWTVYSGTTTAHQASITYINSGTNSYGLPTGWNAVLAESAGNATITVTGATSETVYHLCQIEVTYIGTT